MFLNEPGDSQSNEAKPPRYLLDSLVVDLAIQEGFSPPNHAGLNLVRTIIDAPRARIELIGLSEEAKSEFINIFPRTFAGKIPAYGWRIIGLDKVPGDGFGLKQLANISPRSVVDHLNEQVRLHLQSGIEVVPFHICTGSEPQNIIKKYFGTVDIVTLPSVSFLVWSELELTGSCTTVNRKFEKQLASSLKLSVLTYPDGYSVRTIEVTSDGKNYRRLPEFALYHSDRTLHRNFAKTNDLAILSFASGGLPALQLYLDKSFEDQIANAYEQEDLLRHPSPHNLHLNLDHGFAHSELIHRNRWDNSPYLISGIPPFNLPRLSSLAMSNTSFSQQVNNLEIAETSALDSCPYIVRYASNIGPITISLNSQLGAPGVEISRKQKIFDFLLPDYTLKKAFDTFLNANENGRSQMLSELIKDGYSIQNLKATTDLPIISNLKTKCKELLKNRGSPLIVYESLSKDELFEATKDIFLGRQTFILLNENVTSENFSTLNIAVDSHGDGRIVMESGRGLSLEFFPPHYVGVGWEQQILDYYLNIVDLFNTSPNDLVDKLISECELNLRECYWGDQLKYIGCKFLDQFRKDRHDYELSEAVVRVLNYSLAFYESKLDLDFNIEVEPISSAIRVVVDGKLQALRIPVFGKTKVDLEFEINQKGLAAVDVLIPKSGLSGLWGNKNRHRFTMQPSDGYYWARSIRIIKDSLSCYAQLEKGDLKNINNSALWQTLSARSSRIMS